MAGGRGSTGNVIAAIASFIIPGLGQLAQGRVFSAIFMFIGTGVVWLVTLGTMAWVAHVVAAVHAAVYRPA